MKILVTGSDGFVGKHVVRVAKERGHDVTGFDLEPYNPLSSKIGGLINIARGMDKYDVVIHLAAYIDIKESFEQPWKYVDNNINELKYLYKARRVVFASSAAVYSTFSPYGYAKRLGEALLPENSVSLRMFNPFGPGESHEPETHIVPIIANSILRREGMTLYQRGLQQRSFIDVRDAAEAFVLAAESDITGAYDLCDEKLTIRMVADIMGADYALEKSARDEGDTGYLVATGWDLQAALGWKPKHDVRKELKNWRQW